VRSCVRRDDDYRPCAFGQKSSKNDFGAGGSQPPAPGGKLFGELFLTILACFRPSGSSLENIISSRVCDIFLHFSRGGIAPPVFDQ
jgi:hypothetical protein